jgi:hypothetical protein
MTEDSERSRGTKPFLSRDRNPFTVPPKLPDTFLYFNPALTIGRLDVMIKQRGIRVERTCGIACPCSVVLKHGGTGTPNPACVSCRGLGLAFPEDAKIKFRGLVSDIDEDETSHAGGKIPSGLVRVTAPSGTVISMDDRLVFPDVIVPIPLMRLYDAAVGGMVLPFSIVDVETLTTKGPRPEDPIQVLKRGRDYGLNAEKRLLTFTDGGPVTHNMPVSGTFMAVPDYIVTSTPKASRRVMSSLSDDASVIELPRFVTATRADILIGQQKQEVIARGDAHE